MLLHDRNRNWIRITRSKMIIGFLLMWSLSACDDPKNLFDVDEMIGSLTQNSAEVFLQLGDETTSAHRFKLVYDSISHESGDDYTFETAMETGKAPGETVTFSIASGLMPDSRYYYRVAYQKNATADWQWRTERQLHTQRAPGSSFRFCVIADFHHEGLPGTKKARIVENVQADAPDFVVSLGDMVPLSIQGTPNPVNCAIAYYPKGPLDSQEDADKYYRLVAAQMANFGHSSLIAWVNGNHEGLAGYLSSCLEYQFIIGVFTSLHCPQNVVVLPRAQIGALLHTPHRGPMRVLSGCRRGT